MFSIELDSIQQEQLTGKGLCGLFESPFNDMDRSLVIIRKNVIDTCVGFRVHKKLVITTKKCNLVYPELNPDVVVKYGFVPGLLYASPKTVKAINSKNPEDCGDLVFIEVSVSKQN